MSENQIKLRRNILEFWKQIKILKKKYKDNEREQN